LSCKFYTTNSPSLPGLGKGTCDTRHYAVFRIKTIQEGGKKQTHETYCTNEISSCGLQKNVTKAGFAGDRSELTPSLPLSLQQQERGTVYDSTRSFYESTIRRIVDRLVEGVSQEECRKRKLRFFSEATARRVDPSTILSNRPRLIEP